MLCLYLTQPLTVDEKSKLTYSYAFREFTSEGAGDDGAMTPERQALVDSINEIKQDIAQANIIGAEMCTTLTFRIQVTLKMRLDYNCSKWVYFSVLLSFVLSVFITTCNRSKLKSAHELPALFPNIDFPFDTSY